MGVAALSGAALSLTLAPIDLLPALFAYAPLLLALVAAERDGRRPLEAALLGLAFGFAFHLCGLWWVGRAFLVDADTFGALLPFAVVGLPLLLAPFCALATLLASLAPPTVLARYGALVAAIGLTEFLRGILFTGFPWNVPAVQLASSSVLAQSASAVAVEGASVLAVAIGALPALLFAERSRARGATIAAVAAMLLGLTAFGTGRLATAAVPAEDAPVARIVQPNIAQHHKWDPAHRARIWTTLLGLTGPHSADLVVWPETALPFLYRAPSVEQGELAVALGNADLVAGAAEIEPTGEGLTRTNSVYLIGPGGVPRERYDKVRLVPFGEYVPFAAVMHRLGMSAIATGVANFQRGPGARAIDTAVGPVQPLICYEVVFADFVPASPVRALVNVTNDAWFGRTPGPAQHLRHARLRAIERGLPVLRAANTGISAIIDPQGRMIEALPLGVAGVLEARLPAVRSVPHGGHPRATAGALWVLVLVGAVLLTAASRRPKDMPDG